MKRNIKWMILLLCLSAWNPAWAAIVIKFSHVVASDSPKGKAAEKFKELAERNTQGRVKVELYPNSSLYKDREELEALQLGAVQMLAPSLAKFAPLGIREFEVFDLPYIFPDKSVLYRVTEGAIGRRLLRKLESRGIIGLAYWDNGFKQFSANRPLLHPRDMQGLKMRIQSSKVLDTQMRAVGATPVATLFSEAYPALARGVVDGTENPLATLYTQKMHEVQKHVILSNHGYLGYAVVVNKKFWDGLPDDIRAILTKAMVDTTQYANAIAEEENRKALAAIRKAGQTHIVEPDAQTLQEWKNAMLPVQQQMANRIGVELVHEIQRLAPSAP